MIKRSNIILVWWLSFASSAIGFVLLPAYLFPRTTFGHLKMQAWECKWWECEPSRDSTMPNTETFFATPKGGGLSKKLLYNQSNVVDTPGSSTFKDANCRTEGEKDVEGDGKWTILSEKYSVRKKVMVEGHCGRVPTTGTKVEIKYTGTMLEDNIEFESVGGQGRKSLYEFVLGSNCPNRALDLAVQSMRQGETARIICPASYVYGSKGYKSSDNAIVIPPNAMLCFDVMLVTVWVRIQGG